jgi:hypothetical protein
MFSVPLDLVFPIEIGSCQQQQDHQNPVGPLDTSAHQNQSQKEEKTKGETSCNSHSADFRRSRLDAAFPVLGLQLVPCVKRAVCLHPHFGPFAGVGKSDLGFECLHGILQVKIRVNS